jgi:DNA-binding NarL/FixJ family response regulator
VEPSDPHTKRVLIVDDAPTFRERISARLSKLPGVTIVGQADDVPTAIEAFHKLFPDVVTLDLQMPGGSGLDVLRLIKKERPGTIVIVITNCHFALLKMKICHAGADFFFDKSNEFERVEKVLQDLVANASEGRSE